MASSADKDSNKSDNDYDPFKIRSVRETFGEKEEVIDIINSLEEIGSNLIKSERATERFTCIIDEYQEQPHLLDPYLEEVVNLIISKIKSDGCRDDHLNLLCTCLHRLSKMRGYKVIVQWLPHEVSDVETVIDLLERQSANCVDGWPVRYSLLLWLSMVSMIPFDLSRLDNTRDADNSKLPVMDRILGLCKRYLGVADKSSDAAAYTLARFLTRPDVRSKKMSETVDWCLDILRKNSADQSLASNAMTQAVLRMLSQLYKTGKREDLIPYAKPILDVVVQDSGVDNSSNIVIRKLAVKLTQRIGLVFLKAKVAAWRYNRGNRSLAANLSSGPKVSSDSGSANQRAGDEDEDYDIPDEIEDVIERLLNTLKDKDTIVRWSSAKGLGRISARLPRELADDIISSILELFTFHESDGAWHGGSLALAELGRRGLLLPERLPEVIPVLLRSLVYDEKRGNFSVGSHVRDAACYVCWSFARAYEPADIKPYAQQIASALIVVAVFDREVNVRRAASAAFQENVGRQGSFPHGIEILTTCDFFAVGNRTTSYLELSKFVAGFPEYTQTLINHLVEHKISHWSMEIRSLASKALYSLTPLATGYMSSTVLDTILPMATGVDLNSRHGSIIAVGQICLSLSHCRVPITQKVLDTITTIESKLRSQKMLLGLGGEYMKLALCSLISDMSRVKVPESEARLIAHNHPVIQNWQNLLDECLINVELEVQNAGISALGHFVQLYEGASNPEQLKGQILQRYINQMVSAPNERTRIGTALALGSKPKYFIIGHVDKVLTALIHCTRITAGQKEWAESRRDAILSIEKVCKSVGFSLTGSVSECICVDNLDVVYHALLDGLTDYTIDSRGDVGAWVREASMSAIGTLTSLVVSEDPASLKPDLVKRIFQLIIQQACEKIDRTRALAGKTLTTLLYLQPTLLSVPDRDKLQSLFPQSEVSLINFASPSTTFPKFSQLLDSDAYRSSVLLGLAASVGGLTESLVKHSRVALMDYVDGLSPEDTRFRRICDDIITLYRTHSKVDRVVIPLMKMTEQLLTSHLFDSMTDATGFDFPPELVDCVKVELVRCGDPHKLMAATDVFCGLLMFNGDVRERCLVQLCILLCHKFPIIRKTTAKKLFEAVITVDDVLDAEYLDEGMAILSDTDWYKAVDELRPIRNRLCDMLGIKRPVVKKSKTSADS